MDLFDDFHELEYGAVRRLEQRLQQTESPDGYETRRTTVAKIITAILEIVIALCAGVRYMPRIVKKRVFLRWRGGDGDLVWPPNLNHTANPLNTTDTSPGLRVLLCVDSGSTLVSLYQEPIANIDAD